MLPGPLENSPIMKWSGEESGITGFLIVANMFGKLSMIFFASTLRKVMFQRILKKMDQMLGQRTLYLSPGERLKNPGRPKPELILIYLKLSGT